MDNKQYNALFSFIWNITNDVLVHAFEKGDYKKIILPFMVLRRIDVLLESTKAAVLEKKEFVTVIIWQIILLSSLRLLAIHSTIPVPSR